MKIIGKLITPTQKKNMNTIKFGPILAFVLFFFLSISLVYAAGVTPSLGAAATFGILSSTYTNTAPGTTINGDLGYTTGPGVSPTVTGSTHIADATYNQAGTDQGTASTNLLNQNCDFNFGSATDLSLLSQPLAPGVYCITAATSIGTGGIILNSGGTYVFRITGALTTVASSAITGTASACDIFWTPTQATTLGANSTFKGTIIDNAGITIGSTVNWTGRALSFGGTVSTSADTITVPSCTATPTPTPVPTAAPAASTTTSTTSLSAPGPGPVCTSSGVNVVPTITLAKRQSPTSIFVSWSSPAFNNFIVRYGVQNGVWQFNTPVSGFSTTVNSLPVNQPIWFEVAATDGCVTGSYSGAVSIGGTPLTNTPGFPNTGTPGFPNTGFNPDSFWAGIGLPASVLILSTLILVLL